MASISEEIPNASNRTDANSKSQLATSTLCYESIFCQKNDELDEVSKDFYADDNLPSGHELDCNYTQEEYYTDEEYACHKQKRRIFKRKKSPKHVPNEDLSEVINYVAENEDLKENEAKGHEDDASGIQEGRQFRNMNKLNEISYFGPKRKLRTSKDVYNRLKWGDEVEVLHPITLDLLTIHTCSVYIGYKDRFVGYREIIFDEYDPKEVDFPMHRIYWFRYGDRSMELDQTNSKEDDTLVINYPEQYWPSGSIIIWDRMKRIDLVFKSGNTQVTNS